jgi:hypothetical protein
MPIILVLIFPTLNLIKKFPTLGWFGMFLMKYNSKLQNVVNFNSETIQPPQTLPKFGIIGKHSTSKTIKKGAITVDILGPIIPWSEDNSLRKLMDAVKVVADWRFETSSPRPHCPMLTFDRVLDKVSYAAQNIGNMDLKVLATQDSAARNKASIVFRANYVSSDGTKWGGEFPCSLHMPMFRSESPPP